MAERSSADLLSGSLGTTIPLRLHAHNDTTRVRDVRLSFAENEAFLFAGYKLHTLKLPPGYSQTVTFNLVPIQARTITTNACLDPLPSSAPSVPPLSPSRTCHPSVLARWRRRVRSCCHRCG